MATLNDQGKAMHIIDENIKNKQQISLSTTKREKKNQNEKLPTAATTTTPTANI